MIVYKEKEQCHPEGEVSALIKTRTLITLILTVIPSLLNHVLFPNETSSERDDDLEAVSCFAVVPD